MKVESNAENSYMSFLHYFQPAFSDHLTIVTYMFPYLMDAYCIKVCTKLKVFLDKNDNCSFPNDFPAFILLYEFSPFSKLCYFLVFTGGSRTRSIDGESATGKSNNK